MAIGQIMFSVAAMGMPAYLYKFHPYYAHHLPKKKNDQLTVSLITGCIGFLIVLAAGLIFKDLVNRTFDNSPELIRYYYWLFPFGFGLTMFSLLEAYGWALQKSVVTNFLKEVLFRLLVTLLFTLTFFGSINSFDGFVIFYSFTFLFIALILLTWLIAGGNVNFTFTISNVTKKFRKKILALASFTWGAGLVFNLANVFDTIVLAFVMRPNGLEAVAIYTLGQYICSLIQAPQRAIISASVGPLSQAWKDKDMGKIQRIYQRSSINQLIFACAMFSLIWLNFFDGIETFRLQKDYAAAFSVFLLIGATRIIDMGTGVNAQIIATSVFWRFELKTGFILLLIALPLNYKLTQELGIIGPAISNIISFSIYNFIRCSFLYKQFGLQPFTANSLTTLLLAAFCFIICYFLFREKTGIGWILIRSFLFTGLYAAGVYWLKLTPDLLPVLQTLKKKSGI